ncbi:BTAD domain-containing putative transcriptional regulator [Micromonospora sp. LOL_025]|uniref:AfsR/SARP family transcriptional regulator n=1 Tax=Micromonospora sp. LOL_025 TaxID=3345413 RepID=UPI003A843EF7
MTGGSQVFINVLGPMELTVGDVAVPIGGARQRTVLATLVMHVNRVVSTDLLVDTVWGDAPPPTARNQVQTAISMVRRTLARHDRRTILRTQAPGYLLHLTADDIDAVRFARLSAEGRALAVAGRHAQAAGRLRAALALWRGPALAGLAGGALTETAARLEEQRLAVLAERIRLDRQLGRHHELVGELQELTRRYPLRENLHGELMLTLSRSGRKAEALEAYRRARSVLVEELGLEPGAELRRIEQSILRAPDALPPRQLPTDLPDFTGRATEIAQGTRLLTAETDGVPVLALTGLSGAGKTALAVRVAHRVSASFPDGQLYASLRGEPGRAVTAEVCEHFLRALGVPPGDIPDDPQRRTAVYRSRLAGRRILVLLDNVAQESQLADLLPGSAGCAVVVTSRARLGLLPARHVEVGPLTADEALAMLTRIIGAERVRSQPTAAHSLVALSGQMPLAVRIIGARLAVHRHWPLSRMVRRLSEESRRLDELEHAGVSVRAGLALGYRRLPVTARRLLRRLALVELPDVTVPLCAALLDVGPDEAEEAAERLIEAGLVEAYLAPDGLSRYLLHDLTRAFAGERLRAEEEPSERDAALRRAVDITVARRG